MSVSSFSPRRPAVPPSRRLSWRERPRGLDGALGIAGVVVIWHVLAVTVLDSKGVVPTPWEVVRQLWDDRNAYRPNIRVTLREALLGYLWGNVIAILLGLVFELIPIVEGPLLRLAIAIFNIPLVAIAPILVVTLADDGPKVALAALSVFFTTLVATVLGLRSADPTSLAVVRAYGGGGWMALTKVKLRSALPSLFAGLRIAAPAALLGALIGEYLGANEGLGAAMIQAQSSFAVARTWGLALVVSGLAGMLYLGASFLARWLTPWAGKTEIELTGLQTSAPAGGIWRRIGREAALLVVSIAVLVGAWYALIRGLDLNAFFAKSPMDVYRFLFDHRMAADHRETLLDALGQTLQDAVAGYLVGTLIATAAAIVIVLSPAVEQTIMPAAITLRSVPLVALTPLISLIFGRGFWGVTTVVGIVIFFPTLVNMVVGLRSAPALACDMVRAAGGSQVAIVWKVRLPYALPAFFASARIAAPAAIGGATLAEWLATGKGLGSALVISYSASDFNLAALLLPNLGALSDPQCAAIETFVANGGGLFATGETSRYDLHGNPRPDFALAGLFAAHTTGAHHGSATDERSTWDEWAQHTYLRLTPERRRWVDGPTTGSEPTDDAPRHPTLAGFDDTDLLPFGGRLEVVRPAESAVVPLTLVPPFPIYPPETAWMRTTTSQVPALILNESSGGRVAYLPADLDRSFARSRLPDHAQLLANLTRWVASDRIPLRVDGPGFLHCQLYRQPNRLILHLINLTGHEASSVPAYDYYPVGPLHIALKDPILTTHTQAARLVAGTPIESTSDGGWITFDLDRIVDHEVIVIDGNTPG